MGKSRSSYSRCALWNPPIAEVLEKIRTEADYFERNGERMRYPMLRRQHLNVGSGVIEAGCKTVIGRRLKLSGMFWTVSGANEINAPPLLPPQRRIGGLLGIARPGRLTFIFMSRACRGKPERKLGAVQNTTFICFLMSSICYPVVIESF